ncbi:transmembrane protein 200C [Xiphias gladius]|uniref:transmembrane protein 200C n=1 Tax=Xiphias gladius TaxID=8245 RepID=UPI001A97EAD1|nr:transmembrane protein 200C [Xiphias gladius]XP_039999993.1 transmembrane protein 200C [Xiphias gladius]XP_039999994.1 transmembrane protein 200C [Xiphias gladius]XP_039999995.1 transmembrane protein 200C [Xiphias gladius]
MIATGGLLRMNRRQDSLRSKNRAENKRKRKSKKKKKNDVVVVKGKLNLCSPAGLVAAVGVMVLMVGISMAVLGYWPSQNQHAYQERRRTGAYHTNRMSYSKSPPVSSNQTHNKPPSGQTTLFNQSRANSSAADPSPHCGLLCDFLDNYLYSDNLKVFGPLVMGIGIFLFICANAVLHENRDKKTKIINLRDIYSTVIDLHSIRSKEYSPLNGLVNYTQSRSAEGPSGSFPASGMLARSSWPSAGLGFQGELGGDEVFRHPSLASRPRSWSRDVQTFTDTVYSIYKDYSNSGKQAPQPRQWETTSIVTSSVNAFTLPVIKLNNCEVEESDRAEAEEHSGEGVVIEAAAENTSEEGQASSGQADETYTEEKDASMTYPPPPRRSREDMSTDTADRQGAPQAQPQPQWTQLFPPSPVARAMGSRLSLNSLTDQPRSARRCSLSVSAVSQGERARRFSCPRLERSNSKGYIKLTDLGGESFEAPDTVASLVATEQEVATDAAAAAAAAAAAEEEAQGEDDLVTPSTSAEY